MAQPRNLCDNRKPGLHGGELPLMIYFALPGTVVTSCQGTGGMRDSFAEAQHYKERAEHLRALAVQDQNLQTREALMAIARDYDRMALKIMSQAEQKQS
jgi:hypothetical protein